MREIKFRGQRVDNKEFISGKLYYSNGKAWITDSYNINLNTHNNIAWFEVIPSTIGQYTGLKDKNSIEIYEGDKVMKGTIYCEVIFSKGCFVFKGVGLSMTMRDHEPEEFQIIGNIHTNPELLNQ